MKVEEYVEFSSETDKRSTNQLPGMYLVPAMAGMVLCVVLGFPILAVIPPTIGAVIAARQMEKSRLTGHIVLAAAVVLVVLIRWTFLGVPLV